MTLLHILKMNDEIQFNTSGWDQFYNSVVLSQSFVQFRVDGALGTVTENGLFIATTNGGSGYVYTTYNDLIDSSIQ